MKKLKTKLEELLATYTGQWGVVICQQGTGEKIEINPREPRYLKVIWGIGYKIENLD